MTATFRLPGIAFEVRTPGLESSLPRMDVALLVGFAARGPLQVPVPLDSAEQFAAIFGPDLPLVWDAAGGRTVSAQLCAAVRAFFRNGGQRCWVVRVADSGAAEASRFVLAGLTRPGGAPLNLRATSVGAWADDLRVSAALQPRQLRLSQAQVVEVGGIADGLRLDEPPEVLWPGELLRLRSGETQQLLWVKDVQVTLDEDGRSELRVKVSLAQLRSPVLSPLAPPAPWVAERLRLNLSVQNLSAAGSAPLTELSDLGFSADHPRFLGALPDDETWFGAETPPDDPGKLWADLRQMQVAGSPFPLAFDGDGSEVYLPTPEFEIQADAARTSAAQHSSGSALKRGGLENFSAALFMDARLRDFGPRTLLQEAGHLSSASRGGPEPLQAAQVQGLHAALLLDEVTLVAVPDATLPAWQTWPPDVPTELVLTRPTLPATEVPATFSSCDVLSLAAPQLSWTVAESGTNSEQETVDFSWSTGLMADGYQFEQSDSPVFAPLTGQPGGQPLPGTRLSLTLPAGRHYFRVRAMRLGTAGPWSDTLGLELHAPRSTLSADGRALLAVHRALLAVCAARGDLFALLGLPESWREPQALRHVQALQNPRIGSADLSSSATLSYGALYHPWLTGQDLRAVSPLGAVLGSVARRSNERGAWTAPAGQALQGVVSLTPALSAAGAAALMAARVNPLLQLPGGFMARSAGTLSLDSELEPIGVRRLLMLLRRLALREGNAAVFEPLNASFLRQVKRNFDQALGRLYQRGAFAGRTESESFQVVVDETVNPPRSLDLGRVVVELRVAPSLPLRFLTVRLVQSGDLNLSVEERP